jgi:hypothetical protein
MLKAGSSWLFNLIKDPVVEAGHQDGRAMRERFRLQNFLSASDCTSKTLRIHRSAAISIPHWFGNTYTIKTAGKPTLPSNWRLSSAIRLATAPIGARSSFQRGGGWTMEREAESSPARKGRGSL